MIARIGRIAALSAALSLAACGTATVDKRAPDPTDALTIVVPPTLGGLKVTPSKKATEKLLKAGAGNNNYQKDAQVFELRLGKELQAVLQITRLTADARPEDKKWQQRIIGSTPLIGQAGTQAVREPTRFGDREVYKLQHNRQTLYVWFQSKFMEILMVRSDSITLAQTGAIDVNQLVTEVVSLEPTPV